MQAESALDMVRRRALAPLAKAQQQQLKAVGRARLVRDSARVGSREYLDANALVEDLEAIGRLLDDITAELLAPPAAAAASPQQQAERAAIEGAEAPAVRVVTCAVYGLAGLLPRRHDRGYPSAAGAAVTDRAG